MVKSKVSLNLQGMAQVRPFQSQAGSILVPDCLDHNPCTEIKNRVEKTSDLSLGETIQREFIFGAVDIHWKVIVVPGKGSGEATVTQMQIFHCLQTV